MPINERDRIMAYTQTPVSAWNVNAGARRDANYRRMQELRNEIAAITRGALLQV
jgi:hypothetical protein